MKYDIVNIYNPTYKKKETKEENLKSKYGKYILSVARLEEPKDFITLIEAYNELDEEMKKEYSLVIVGDGPDRKKIEKEIGKLNLKDRVYLTGSQDNVDKYYQSASLFVLSTKSEGLGMVIVESMGNGCPVIATDAPYGPRDIIGNNEYGILCPVGNFKKMSVAIKEVLEDNKLRKRLIENGLKRYEDFKIETIIKEFDDLMEN
ncbi:MAG: glycosyltransferase [Candidatus Gastranaerophilaceae bacterium]